jgi:hypothetical protein
LIRDEEKKTNLEMAAGDRHVKQDILGKQMLAGGLAGMLADGVMYPMMTVKSRLMVCTPPSSHPDSNLMSLIPIAPKSLRIFFCDFCFWQCLKN